MPDTYVLQHNSLDAYFLLRYLKMSILITGVGCLLTWPILFPIAATGQGGREQLDMMTLGNIDPYSGDGYKYFAFAFAAWIFIAFVFLVVTRELIYAINLRQAYLLSPVYADRISSRTVLFQSVPKSYANAAKIRQLFGDQMKSVWIAQDTDQLEDNVDRRTKAAMKLESAETKLIKLCNKARLEHIKKHGQEDETLRAQDAEVTAESGSVAARYIDHKQRPAHRLKFLFGKKVDSINWARHEIATLNPIIAEQQDAYRAGRLKATNGVFVEFYRQTDAQAAYQMVAHHQPLHMSPRVVGLSPQDVIWKNLSITWRTRAIRNAIAITAVVVTIIFWSMPVAVVGSISNINYIAAKVAWLEWILTVLPPYILGVVTGLLPSIALALLMALLPPYLRFLGRFAGLPTKSFVELRVHESFFWFQLIQVFLITTMTSAASSAIPQIVSDPTSAPKLLAQSLPASSNFYVSYFILQGLTFASGALLQIFGLLLFHVLSKVLDTTPRKMYTRWSELSGIGWGTIFPVLEMLVVIAIAYSTIAPLVMGFSVVGLTLFYYAYKYNLLYVNMSAIDTKGLVYAKALKHTLVGCYLSVGCLTGLFAVASGGTGKGPLVMMIMLLVTMILYHISLNAAVKPLLLYLPRSLEAEEDALLGAESGSPAGYGPDSEKAIAERIGSNIEATPSRTGLVGLLKKFVRPDIYASYSIMRRLVPRDFGAITYSPQVERDAYQHPAVNDVAPLLWIPRDEMGVSRQEVAHTSQITPITDEGASFDSKGRITWHLEETGGRPPIWEETVYY